MTTLADARHHAGLTQRQLAAIIGVPYQHIQRWEQGQRRPEPENVEALAAALGRTSDEVYAMTRQVPADIVEALTTVRNTPENFRRVRIALAIHGP